MPSAHTHLSDVFQRCDFCFMPSSRQQTCWSVCGCCCCCCTRDGNYTRTKTFFLNTFSWISDLRQDNRDDWEKIKRQSDWASGWPDWPEQIRACVTAFFWPSLKFTWNCKKLVPILIDLLCLCTGLVWLVKISRQCIDSNWNWFFLFSHLFCCCLISLHITPTIIGLFLAGIVSFHLNFLSSNFVKMIALWSHNSSSRLNRRYHRRLVASFQNGTICHLIHPLCFSFVVWLHRVCVCVMPWSVACHWTHCDHPEQPLTMQDT